jgi:hypothetical protein
LTGTAATWHWRNPLPTGTALRSVAYGNGTFVAVGDAGTIFSSTNGMQWEDHSFNSTNHLKDIAFGNGQFLAVGSQGLILTSDDGSDWAMQSSTTTNDLWSVAFGGGKYVTAGGKGTVVVSSDGIGWSAANSGINSDITSVTWGNGVFVGTYQMSGSVLVSTDASNWSSHPTGSDGYDNYDTQLVFGNGVFLLHAYTNSGPFSLPYNWTSSDGTNWTIGGFSPETRLTTAFLNGQFLAASIPSGTNITVFSLSPNGVVWTNISLDAEYNIRGGIAYGNNRYVMAGLGDGGVGQVWVSTNLSELSLVTSGAAQAITSIAQGAGLYVAMGNPILVSTNGLSFSPVNPTNPPGKWNVRYGGGVFVAAGGDANIVRSTNGLEWVQRNGGTANSLKSVAYGNSGWTAVGLAGTVTTSPDGRVWTARMSGTGNDLFGVTYGLALFVAVGGNGTVITSPNGIDWTAQYTETLSTLRDVAYGNGLYITVGDGGTVLTSPDATNWMNQSSGTTKTLMAVAGGQGQFFIVGDPTVGSAGFLVLGSTDSAVWQPEVVHSSYELSDCSFLNGSFWLVGLNGAILQSDAFGDLLKGRMLPADTGYELTLFGIAGSVYRMQARTSFSDGDWSDVITLTNTQDTATWVDTDAAQYPSRFYRAVSP